MGFKIFFFTGLLFVSYSAAAGERYCGKITNMGLHNVDGNLRFNFGVDYQSFFRGETNSFDWLNPNDPKEKEAIEFLKFAKVNNLTVCMDHPININKPGGAIEIK